MGDKAPAPKSVPVSVGESPGNSKSGPPVEDTSPGKHKSPIPAPPKAPELPRLPELPKAQSELEPPKGSLPVYPPGQPPYHGSGGHLPVSDGGHNQDHGKASSIHSCIKPMGIERLRCQKWDAVVVTLIAIVAVIAAPFLIYKCIKCCKQRRSRRKNRHEEEAIELTSRAMNCDPDPETDREVLDGSSNIGLAISTSEETFNIAREQSQDITSGSSPAENSSEVWQPRTRNLSLRRKPARMYLPRTSLNRGRSLVRPESLESLASSLSSGMIRTAVLGETFQDPTIIDVLPSPANSRKNSERMSSSGDADVSNNDDDGRRDSPEEGGRDCVERNMESDDITEAKRRSKSSSRKSSSRGPEGQSDDAVGSPDRSSSRHSFKSSKSSCSGNPWGGL